MASEYGWAKREILENVYLDELYFLTREINKRRLHNYQMQLLIAQNPFSKNPKEIFTEIEKQEAEIEGKKQVEEFDANGFERLKLAMRANPRIQVKS